MALAYPSAGTGRQGELKFRWSYRVGSSPSSDTKL